MDTSQAKRLGQMIQKYREAKNLSQVQLAKQAGVPYSTVAKIEIGVIKNPSVFKILKIAKALDISLDDMM